VDMGFTSLWSKFKYNYYFLMAAAYLCNVIGYVLGMKLKLNPFNVKVLVMVRAHVPLQRERACCGTCALCTSHHLAALGSSVPHSTPLHCTAPHRTALLQHDGVSSLRSMGLQRVTLCSCWSVGVL
jgi:hypothetical protein